MVVALRPTAIAIGIFLAVVARSNAMDFNPGDHLTVRASGPIEAGDARSSPLVVKIRDAGA